MSVRIYGLSHNNRKTVGCTSININDPNLQLVSKTEIYRRLFDVGVYNENFPHISCVYQHGSNINSDTITYVENFKPDIFVVWCNGSVNILEHLRHRPKIIIGVDGINKKITYNGEPILSQFNDLGKSNINRILENCSRGCKEIVNGKQIIIGNRSEFERLFYDEGFMYCAAFEGTIKRLILEYLTQYKDNPTINIAPKDDKADLLELVNNMQTQLNELRQRIANM